MKANLRTAIVFSALAAGLGLTSCVAPYDAYGSSSVTTYSTGHRINTLPGGYRTETLSGNTYYYHDGHYYNRRSGGYVVVDAPRSSRYYGDYNRYRSQHSNRNSSHSDRNDRYDRNDRNNHDRNDRNSHGRNDRYDRNDNVQVINRLPNGYRPVTVRGQTYYHNGSQYYRRQGNGYVTVNRPR